MLSGIEKLAFIILTFILMCGIGTSITSKSVSNLKRNPRLIFAGAFSQVFWMPLAAYLCGEYLSLPNFFALSLVLIGCTPGGALSNIFSYLAKSDVLLSVSLTVVSTIISFISFPLLLKFYLGNNELFNIPTINIIGSLLFMIIPVALGAWLAKAKPQYTKALEKVCSVIGIILIVYLVASGLYRNYSLLATFTKEQYFSIFFVITSGYMFGWLFSKLCKADKEQARTVSFETGIQNIPLTISIILMSFDPDSVDVNQLMLAPMLYALFTVIIASFVTIFYRRRV